MSVTSPAAPHDLVVIHLSGGNDYLNTVVPYGDPLYYDERPTLGLRPEDPLPVVSFGRDREPGVEVPSVLPIDERIGLHGGLAPLRPLYDEGNLAISMGVGYPDRDRSHFRSLDIWHTAEPAAVINEGWLGKTADRLDPRHDDPVLLVNVGRALPLALSYPGVMAASLEAVEAYNIFPEEIADEARHAQLAQAARNLYGGVDLPEPWRYAQLVGGHALTGIDRLRAATEGYQPAVVYPPLNRLAARLRTIAQIKCSGVGTRVYYTTHDGYDTHQDQRVTQQRLLEQLSEALVAFLADLEAQESRRETVILVFSEFGRRIAENGSGTDHGGAGVAFLIGNHVRGGLYGDYPSLRPADQIDGDLRPSIDFREVYAAILEQFVGVDAHDVLDPSIHALRLRSA